MPAPPLVTLVKSSSKPGKAADIRTIILGNGTELKLTLAEIPDPPAVSFVDNIPRLNQMWDDTSIHWRNESRLYIQDHAIALSHWPVLYKYSGAPTWKGIKGKFFEWKVSGDIMALTGTFHLHTLSLPRCLSNASDEACPKNSGQSSLPLLVSHSRIQQLSDGSRNSVRRQIWSLQRRHERSTGIGSTMYSHIVAVVWSRL
jgi:hypothetical protein